MTLSDKFLVAFVVNWLAVIGIMWYKHMYGMSILWAQILASVLAVETLSYAYTGFTVTQLFREVVRHDPGTGWGLIGLMSMNWAFLMLHFGIGLKK